MVPDGTHLVFGRHNTYAEPQDGRAVFTVALDGSDERQVTPWSSPDRTVPTGRRTGA